jgi:hypothetical protein
MARSQGDLTYQWGTAGNVVAWTSGGPESLSDDSYTSLSDEIDLAGLDNALDLLVSARLRTAAGSIGSDPYCHIFAAAPADGISYPDDPDNWQPVGKAIDVPAADTVAYSSQFSVAQSFGGVLPARLRLALYNKTGLALNATTSDVDLYYQVVYANVQP